MPDLNISATRNVWMTRFGVDVADWKHWNATTIDLPETNPYRGRCVLIKGLRMGYFCRDTSQFVRHLENSGKMGELGDVEKVLHDLDGGTAVDEFGQISRAAPTVEPSKDDVFYWLQIYPQDMPKLNNMPYGLTEKQLRKHVVPMSLKGGKGKRFKENINGVVAYFLIAEEGELLSHTTNGVDEDNEYEMDFSQGSSDTFSDAIGE